jgi:hypothetical protein
MWPVCRQSGRAGGVFAPADASLTVAVRDLRWWYRLWRRGGWNGRPWLSEELVVEDLGVGELGIVGCGRGDEAGAGGKRPSELLCAVTQHDIYISRNIGVRAAEEQAARR